MELSHCRGRMAIYPISLITPTKGGLLLLFFFKTWMKCPHIQIQVASVITLSRQSPWWLSLLAARTPGPLSCYTSGQNCLLSSTLVTDTLDLHQFDLPQSGFTSLFLHCFRTWLMCQTATISWNDGITPVSKWSALAKGRCCWPT